MASGSATREYHSAASVAQDTVTLTAVYRYVLVINRDTTAANALFVTAGTDVKAPPTVSSGLADSWVVPAGQSRLVLVEAPQRSASSDSNPTETVVHVIAAAGTPSYTVAGN